MPVKLSRREVLEAATVAVAISVAAAGCHRGGGTTPAKDPASAQPLATPVPSPTKPLTEMRLNPADIELITPTDARYAALKTGYNLRIQHHPAAIAMCKTTEGVSAAVRYAAARGWKIAVRSGGHSFEGYSGCDDGMVIHLRSMHAIKHHEDQGITVGPGCILRELYTDLLPKNRIVPAGSCATVGAGGLALGGGYGFFSRTLGLTCDSLEDITFVDGAGNVLSGKTNPELMWGCRGGGTAGLGVATELTFKTHAAPAAFRSWRFKARVAEGAHADAILAKWFAMCIKLPQTSFSAFVLNGKVATILITGTEAPDATLTTVLQEMRSGYKQTSTGLPQPLEKALPNYYGQTQPLRFKNASGGYYAGYSSIEAAANEILSMVIATPGLMFQVNTLGGAIQNPEAEARSCYAHRSLQFLAEVQAYWDRGEAPKQLMDGYTALQRAVAKCGITAHYANYPSSEFINWPTAYYASSYPRLQALKKLTDPSDLFHFEQSIRLPG